MQRGDQEDEVGAEGVATAAVPSSLRIMSTRIMSTKAASSEFECSIAAPTLRWLLGPPVEYSRGLRTQARPSHSSRLSRGVIQSSTLDPSMRLNIRLRASIGPRRRKLVSRVKLATLSTPITQGPSDGSYVLFEYRSKFSNKAEVVERLTEILCDDGKWRLAGYQNSAILMLDLPE
jgi:uncharacterized protein DUF4019